MSSSALNTTFEVEASVGDVDTEVITRLTAKPPAPLKLRRQRSSRASRLALEAIQTTDNVRSSDEFEKPLNLRRSNSAGSLRKKSSTGNLRKKSSTGNLRKKSSTSDLGTLEMSDEASVMVEEGGLYKKKRKLHNTTRNSFFSPPE